MLYVQLKERLFVVPGQTVTLQDVADILSESPEKARQAQKIRLNIRSVEGVWRFPAAAVVLALLPLMEEVSLLGADEVFVHVTKESKYRLHRLRAAAAFLILFFGSMLAIGWFHADVGMEKAQQTFVRRLSGREADNPVTIAVPYALGVTIGVGGYYALIGKRKTVSPLEIKLNEYRTKAEKTAGKVP